ncbi:hypothetical protein [Sphingobium sp.]|uniref:hypothetical protein n=1 Tax=Sphingobium sp. TaxID=1912891 RepID=UPI003B3BE612
MTRNSPSRRKPDHARQSQHVYLPHSSWARVERKPAVSTPIAPDDFWARLGI